MKDKVRNKKKEELEDRSKREEMGERTKKKREKVELWVKKKRSVEIRDGEGKKEVEGVGDRKK